MRLAFALALLVGSFGSAHAQQRPDTEVAKDPDPRFGVPSKLRIYPQDTAKKALASAIEAVEKPDIAYLIAHLMDPGFVDAEIGERTKQFEATVEPELSRQRDFQIRNPDKVRPEDRLPTDRADFKALVVQRSQEQAFRKLVRDVQEKLLNDPQVLRDLKKVLRDGTFTDNATGTKVTHPDVKERALFLRKIGDRWFLENRQDEAAIAPKKE